MSLSERRVDPDYRGRRNWAKGDVLQRSQFGPEPRGWATHFMVQAQKLAKQSRFAKVSILKLPKCIPNVLS